MIPNPVLREERANLRGIEKAPTGIIGLDEITYGGLPKGRPTLLCGAAGCGKTLFAMTFLYQGAVEYQEPGVFVAFEERPSDLITNVGSLHYDIQKLIADKKTPELMRMVYEQALKEKIAAEISPPTK